MADPSLLDTITLTLPAAENIRTIQGVLFNGQTISEDYTIQGFSGAANVGTITLTGLPDKPGTVAP